MTYIGNKFWLKICRYDTLLYLINGVTPYVMCH